MAPSQRDRTWTRACIDVVTSLAAALLMFGALPAVLVVVVGNPLGAGLGHTWSHTDRYSVTALAAVAWVAWAACCTQLTRSVIDHVRRGHVHLPAGSPLTEKIAARIAAGVLTLSALGAPMALSTQAGATVPSQTRPVIMTVRAELPSGTESPAAPTAVAQPAPTYRVQPGDSLWSIADSQLGDGADWTAIAALNLGRTMVDGARFVDPSMIEPGWVLEMPNAEPQTQFEPQPIPTTAASGPPAVPSQPTSLPYVPTAHISAVAQARNATRPTAGTPDGRGTSNLPELAILGIGALGCAALARRSRHLHLLRRTAGPDQRGTYDRPDNAVDADSLVGRFAGVPVLTAFESANALLRRSLVDERPLSARRVRAVCVGPSGVDFWWATDTTLPAPAPFVELSDRAWRVAHESLRPVHDAEDRPFLPVALVVGDNTDGTWLVPVQPGICVPIIGESAQNFWRSAEATQAAWAWADQVLITEDPMTVDRETRLSGDGLAPSPDALQILFFGDPSDLAPALRARVAIVTTAPRAASDVTIVVDRWAASIHPLGRVVRPHLLRPDASALVAELVALSDQSAIDEAAAAYGAVDAMDPRCDEVPEDPAGGPAFDVTPISEPDVPQSSPRIDHPVLPTPGAIEVKLLTTTPRLEGLQDALPANRARRAVELVAYLALHQPDAVTSDRLRTRVLGSSDADAASKTLFNTAAAARRAMGTDSAGQPLFPPGSRTGHYRVTGAVTVDVHRAAQLAEIGNATEDPELAISILRDALELIEGEPLANALSGFTWWEAEGHGARIAAVLVNAACNLAALAVDGSYFELALWGLEKARLVEPYSESLSRAAMQVAAAAGDADRLRREWRECQRRVDELDPGSAPSPRTERLYGELAQRVLVGAAPGALD